MYILVFQTGYINYNVKYCGSNVKMFKIDFSTPKREEKTDNSQWVWSPSALNIKKTCSPWKVGVNQHEFALSSDSKAADVLSASVEKQSGSEHTEGVYLIWDKSKNMSIGVEEVMLPDCWWGLVGRLLSLVGIPLSSMVTTNTMWDSRGCQSHRLKNLLIAA